MKRCLLPPRITLTTCVTAASPVSRIKVATFVAKAACRITSGNVGGMRNWNQTATVSFNTCKDETSDDDDSSIEEKDDDAADPVAGEISSSRKESHRLAGCICVSGERQRLWKIAHGTTVSTLPFEILGRPRCRCSDQPATKC